MAAPARRLRAAAAGPGAGGQLGPGEHPAGAGAPPLGRDWLRGGPAAPAPTNGAAASRADARMRARRRGGGGRRAELGGAFPGRGPEGGALVRVRGSARLSRGKGWGRGCGAFLGCEPGAGCGARRGFPGTRARGRSADSLARDTGCREGDRRTGCLLRGAFLRRRPRGGARF